MESFTILPLLGLKTSVPQNDLSLFQGIDKGFAITHAVDGTNFDFQRTTNACNKTKGTAHISSSKIADPTGCQGLFNVDDGTNNEIFIWEHGNTYHLNLSTYVPEEIVTDGGAPALSATTTHRISAVKYGDYVVFTDDVPTTVPYCWKNGLALSAPFPLLSGGTGYKFKYLETFHGRIIGASSDQTNGDIELRWTDRLVDISPGVTMATINQIYKPDDDKITGIKKMGRNACFVYGENSIDRLDYYPNYTSPFDFTGMVSTQGCESHHSIVDVGARHFLFNKNYGFCEYHGGVIFPANGKPISEPIENLIEGIYPSAQKLIHGCFSPVTNEIAWAVPLYGAEIPSHILFYNINDGTWRVKEKAVQCIEWIHVPDVYTWDDLIAELGGADATWADVPTGKWWSSYSTERPRLVYSNIDGYVDFESGEDDVTAAWESYRVEPIMDFGSPEDRDLLLELWFNSVQKGAHTITVYHRGADVVSEIPDVAWTSLGTIMMDGSAEPVLYTDQNYRFHQIKWGNSTADTPFSINKIEFKYVRQGRY